MRYLLHHCVDEVAVTNPERIAFCTPGREITYAALARVTSQLAGLLARHGVKRGDRVGIFMPRCLESPMAVYGALKAGAVFVPIDPGLPAASVMSLLDDCGIRVLLSHNTQRKTLQQVIASGAHLDLVVGLDDALEDTRTLAWAALASLPAGAEPQYALTEDDLAYVMYSSGSTGVPKGIMHTHRSGLAYARLSSFVYGLNAEDRIGSHAPLHVDMSTLGFFSAMYAGATTVLIPEAHTRMVASLAELVENQRISVWYSVPLALVQLLARGELESRDMSRLRWVIFGGEPFPVRSLHALMQLWPAARFSNAYGPAEVNQCTFFHVPRDADGAAAITDDRPIPLGSIWPNAEGLVLDERDRAADRGASGELLIRSPTMMRGYWGRGDLNGRVFFRQPSAGGVDRVFFRTGDRVRINDDGLLEFIGRMDRQIKIRGYRVDLDDVEHALALLAPVLEAAAYAVRQDGSVVRIEAAVLAAPGQTVDDGALRKELSGRLAAYAVPECIRVEAELPRTTGGKIDRRALQAAAEGRSKADE